MVRIFIFVSLAHEIKYSKKISMVTQHVPAKNNEVYTLANMHSSSPTIFIGQFTLSRKKRVYEEGDFASGSTTILLNLRPLVGHILIAFSNLLLTNTQ